MLHAFIALCLWEPPPLCMPCALCLWVLLPYVVCYVLPLVLVNITITIYLYWVLCALYYNYAMCIILCAVYCCMHSILCILIMCCVLSLFCAHGHHFLFILYVYLVCLQFFDLFPWLIAILGVYCCKKILWPNICHLLMEEDELSNYKEAECLLLADQSSSVIDIGSLCHSKTNCMDTNVVNTTQDTGMYIIL